MLDLDFDSSALCDWLDALRGDSAHTVISRMRGGGSCDLFEIRRGDAHWVMRRAPANASSATAHNVIREHTIIAALQDQDVRVPTIVGACEDPGVANAPFYLMEFIDGEVIRRKLPDCYRRSPATQPCIGAELIDALVQLHAVDWQQTLLRNLGQPENFLGRQVGRWMSQLESYRCRNIEGVDQLAGWLDQNRPRHGSITLMHGDYKLDNAIFSTELPPQLLSLLDFEMSTIGDPIIDLAWAMIFWPEQDNRLAIAGFHEPGGMDPGYCQTPRQLQQRYAQATGRSLDEFDWYQAFAAWKLGIVLEGSYAKHLRGESGNPKHEFFGFMADQLMLRARRFAV
ncbi:MAG: phosphotransferase family protein [Gammaproteobacteria bacterium]|jgi:aminoglycoside phosphotransferase (APT) family kinase protein|nr:phosphotransferase family protein [Gammaproteobacteria bacterium]MBP6052866.1 phosphotransferase family protein [Pseudomonadales bacterium]MBK6582371.1 phosphotransferase family protein [Gammaproteobacteria bacterium]MBK7171480.1 phosphotransferase family protein [Gammaproteobacteria bacterium]MBK7729136.1 phosphotransferase family protein [Gammaproteobacteria bacterium]